jgi:hypothetical protein
MTKKKPETELRWVKRTREESLFYLVEVVKGTPDKKILEVFEASEVAYETAPDESKVHNDSCEMTDSLATPREAESYKKGDIGYNFVAETT